MAFVQDLRSIMKEGIVLEQEPMARHTTFCVGGPADYFVEPATREEVWAAIACAKKHEIPCFVIGNGSNLLVSDEGYRGMILHIGKRLAAIRLEEDTFYVEAGAQLTKLAHEALHESLTGLEFAAGIPGSIGGAVAMNAGAYGGEIKDVLVDADVLTEEGEILTLTGEELDLSYRHSCIFEKNYIVLSAHIRLSQGDPALIKGRMDELLEARKSKQPLEYPSAGSTFKRPEGYFAGKLIQDADLKGYTVGGAQVSAKHSGFVVNRGGATAEEIVFLIRQVQKKVKAAFGVDLETEVRFLGF